MTSPEGRTQLHIHTNRGDGLVSFESILETSEGLGLNIIAITNHNRLANEEANRAAQLNSRVSVIRGIEITAVFPLTHAIGLFPDENHFPKACPPLLIGIERTVDWIHENHGLAGLAHPISVLTTLSAHPERFIIFDFIEAMSKTHGETGRNRFVNMIFRTKLKDRLASIGAGDIHFPYPRDKGWNFETQFPGTTVPDLVTAIYQRQTIPIRRNLRLSSPTIPEILEQQKRSLLEDPFETGLFTALARRHLTRG